MELAAASIVERTGIRAGFCIDLGCGNGELCEALARSTQLHIYGIEQDADLVASARRRLSAAGLYGVRITIQQGDPTDTNFLNRCADLVVSAKSLEEGPDAIPRREAERLQKPYGGVICFGPVGAEQVTVRGALAGAGSWTHQYANAANTVSSDDELVNGQLRAAWFGDIDIHSPQRGHSPLFLDGRLIVEGFDAVGAVDAYNGRLLWRYELPDVLGAYRESHYGTAVSGSNICASQEGVYIALPEKVLRLDAASGELLSEFSAPKRADGTDGRWGHLAVDDGLLFGSLAIPEYNAKAKFPLAAMQRVLSESAELFAMEARTGKIVWRYRAAQAIRHNSIAIGAGRVYFVDRPLAMFDVGPAKSYAHPGGTLLCLDARTGKEIWRTETLATTLALSAAHDTLVGSYQKWRWSPASERGRRLWGYRASTGEPMWQAEGEYNTRLVVSDRTIYAEGGAWDSAHRRGSALGSESHVRLRSVERLREHVDLSLRDAEFTSIQNRNAR